jgi:hypothetical protein
MSVVGQAVGDPGAKSFFSSPEFLWSSVALVGVLLLGALGLALARLWRNRLMDNLRSLEGEVEHYQALYHQGEISREEFERITGLLAHPAPEATAPPGPKPPSAPQAPPGPPEPGAPAA